jgi:heme/copper-type cytochrome/quinol oxidase subunit 1
MLSCSIWFSAPSFWMGGGLESRCVGRVCGVELRIHQKNYLVASSWHFTLFHYTVPLGIFLHAISRTPFER